MVQTVNKFRQENNMKRVSRNTRKISFDAMHHEHSDAMVRIFILEQSPCPIPKHVAGQYSCQGEEKCIEKIKCLKPHQHAGCGQKKFSFENHGYKKQAVSPVTVRLDK